MIILNLNRKSETPLFRQIYDQVKDKIETSILKPGFRMPSSRSLAERLGVHRSTVYKAYEELWAMGYIKSRPGSYSVVRKRREIASKDLQSQKGLIEWSDIASDTSKKIHVTFQEFYRHRGSQTKSPVINLATLDLDSRLFPMGHFRKCLNTVMIERSPDILKYGDSQGYKPLRQYIANRLQIYGVSTSSEEILITNGSQNGYELLLKLLTSEDSGVVVESPTYSNILPILNFYKTKIIGVPMQEEGIDLMMLADVLKTQKPAFLYTIPNFQNPTGITTNQTHREALLALCQEYRVPIVEDAFEEEMKYFGRVPLPIKSMDKYHIVIYLGTFSKVLFPGIRVGWIAAEKECIQRLLSLKTFSDLSSNSLIQAALAEFCSQGFYDLHIKKMHRVYRKRMHVALKALKKFLPFEKVSWTEPTGGYLIWLKFEDINISDEELEQLFLKQGVIVSPGKYFFPESTPHKHIRISISTVNEEELEQGISRIGKALSRVYKS